jgi:RNA polymerase sigma-70 factor (ECF subfamily)
VAPNDSDSERDVADAVRAVRAGDAQAYSTIVKRFQGPLMTLCTALLRNRHAAEELAQDALVRAYERLDLFDARQPMKPWLYKIAYRLAQQRRRAQSRETARQEAAVTMTGQNRSDSGPAERLFADERSEMLWEAVSELPMAQRTAVVLYYRENLTIKEVAKALGVSPGTIKTHLFRARFQIQVSLRDREFDEGDIS